VAAIRGIIAWQLASAFKVGGAGKVIIGLVLSVTVTLKVHIRLVLPEASVAV
jgi:selenocysteine-specific translation elongation factor